MDSLIYSPHSVTFHYDYDLPSGGEPKKRISHQFLLPFEANTSTREYAYIVIKRHHLPEYLESKFIEQFESFVSSKIDEIQSHTLESMIQHRDKWIDKAKSNLERIGLADASSCENRNQRKDDIIHDENFYLMYHTIVHSGILTSQLIQLENHNSQVIRSLLEEKDEYIRSLTEEQNQKLEEILTSGAYTEKEINMITKSNFTFAEKSRNEWLERIKNVRSDQKREFYTWIKNTYEDIIKEVPKTPNISHVEEFEFVDKDVDDMDENELEESYTINLGSQLKTTHNLRLISTDMLKFCKNTGTPHRFQTAMSLYSNSISAIVLLVDKSLNNSMGIKYDFAKLSLGASENHFHDFDLQLNSIKSEFFRSKYTPQKNGNVTLKPGDVYITKHSNLSEVHIVFHLVTDDSINSSEINSRHPVILGLRNILKIAYIYDIAHLSLPLLLLHQMNENITIQWCLRRAELILKCVKGFMIEMSSLLSLNDNENKTIQFVVPKGISHELFSSLSAIFPSVFRLSNTLFLTATHA